jgi:hypothetical protein
MTCITSPKSIATWTGAQSSTLASATKCSCDVATRKVSGTNSRDTLTNTQNVFIHPYGEGVDYDNSSRPACIILEAGLQTPISQRRSGQKSPSYDHSLKRWGSRASHALVVSTCIGLAFHTQVAANAETAHVQGRLGTDDEYCRRIRQKISTLSKSRRWVYAH